ncbi:unnamed protein product [Boreogadus saida]
MNRDMEVKGIVLRELSCRTCRRAPRAGAARLPPRPTPAGPCQLRRQFSSWSTSAGCSRKASAAVQLPGTTPELPDCRPDGFDGYQLPASAAVGGGSRQSTPAGLPLKLRRQSGGSSSVAGRQPEYIRRSSRKASAAVKLPEYNAGAAKLPDGRLRRQPDCRSSFGGSPLVVDLSRRELTCFLTRPVTIVTLVNTPAKPNPYVSSPRYGHPRRAELLAVIL